MSAWIAHTFRDGLLADMPAGATVPSGIFYLATDESDGTLYMSTGSAWEQVAAGVSAAGGGSPTGSAGGVLDGTYPNPGLAAGVAGAGLAETSDVLSVNVDGSTLEINTDALRVKALGITDSHVAAANKDGTTSTPSMRTLGTGAAQAAAGNDSRLSDSRAPSGSAGGDLTGTYPNPTLATAGPGATGPIGDSTHVAAVTIDAKGRVTGLSSVAISASGAGAAIVATTIAALPDTPADGTIAMLRVGSSPYTFMPLIYDATYAKWVSQIFYGPSSSSTADTTTSTTYTAAPNGRMKILGYKELYDAGLRPFIRLTGLINSSTGTISLRLRASTWNDADTTSSDDAHSADPTISHNTNTNTLKTSDWVELAGAPTKAHANLLVLFKTSSGTGTMSVYQATLRWEAVAA